MSVPAQYQSEMCSDDATIRHITDCHNAIEHIELVAARQRSDIEIEARKPPPDKHSAIEPRVVEAAPPGRSSAA